MSTDKPSDPFAPLQAAPFAAPAGGLFAAPTAGAFGAGPVDAFAVDDTGAQFWDAVTEEALSEEGSPEGIAKRVLNEVEQAFKDRAQAEEKRVLEAVDSEYWICLVFQTRGQKDEFLKACGADMSVMGDKYIEGPDFAKLIGRPVTPVAVRYNISSKLDRRLNDMSRGFDELTGLGPQQPEGA